MNRRLGKSVLDLIQPRIRGKTVRERIPLYFHLGNIKETWSQLANWLDDRAETTWNHPTIRYSWTRNF